MKMNDIRDMSQTDIRAKVRELKKELFNLQLQKASARLEKPSQIRNIRRDIARLETQLSSLKAAHN
jgi:large subunit ribosomal protein L29